MTVFKRLFMAGSAFCALSLAGPALGQETSGVCLGFTDGLALAVARAPEVDGARAREAEARADLREANSLSRPQVSSFGRTGVGDSGLTGSQIDNQLGVRVSQRVFDFGDSRLAREAAQGSVDQSEFDTRYQRNQAAYEFADAYLTWLEAEEKMGVIAQRRAYFVRQHEAITALLRRGGATRADNAQIVAQLASADAEALELRFTVDRAATRILEYSGRPSLPCASEHALAALDSQLSGLATVDDVVASALSAHPRIGSQRGAIRALEAQRERQSRARLPVVEVVGIVSYVYDDASEDWDTRDRVGVDVSVPLYTGAALNARSERAQARLSQEESGLRALQRDLSEEAEIAFRRSLSLQAQLLRREAVAESQLDYFEAVAGEFERGLGTLPVLIDARLDYESAALDVVSTRYALMRQKLDLMRLTARMPVAAD
ncbi:TolC family protein [Maricaulis sp.]|uniref:TolC family protein n=1 Tax=Maricaulis sp. TaxID=1486257 RepID=UPI003A9568A4